MTKAVKLLLAMAAKHWRQVGVDVHLFQGRKVYDKTSVVSVYLNLPMSTADERGLLARLTDDRTDDQPCPVC